ncbi:AAA family ATPase [Streptomyces sp. NPDC059985]|uniref:AAA family ATPase n=1 Tax=Streptomyces sp. NPDC059985 TaxID=3347025 RepID=UPI0036768E03
MSGSAVSGRAARKCEQAWVRGVELLRQGNPRAAGEAFEAAVGHDPSAADAWLGLHAAGLRGGEAVEAMYARSHAFGALRARLRTPLVSRFQIGGYVDFRLESRRDLWLAKAAKLLDEDRPDEAWQMLSSALLDCDETRFVLARYAFVKRDWPLLLRFAPGIGDAFLLDESQLYVAAGLVAQGVHHEALNVLRPLPHALRENAGFLGEVCYLRGLAYEGLGRAEDALKQFQTAFRYSPGLADVAQRARAVVAPAPAPPAAAPTGRTVPAQAGGPPRERPAGAAGPSEEDRTAMLDGAMAELEAMVGLVPVKRQIRALSAQLRMAAVRRAQGVGAAPAPMHLVFAGPPGTGKTTVARIVGQVFAGLGMLERGHVVEVQRVDLVGQHLGSTALKTTKAIDRALDGVLFVDEAYALVNDGYSGGDAFGNEALQVLLKRAEDDRHRLVVVLAGYPQEIRELLAANPGLSSRFNTRVDFPAYSAEELVLIAESFLDGQDDVPTDDAVRALRTSCERVVADGLIDRLGNGRFARELATRAARLRDLRVADMLGMSREPSLAEVTTIHANDVTDAYRELAEGVEPAW